MTPARALAPPEITSVRDRVVEHVRRLIEKGTLGPGDRLPGERDLAQELGVSRPSVRSGLEALEAIGVVVSRRGAGTFIAEGPPDLGIEPLSLLASLHRLTAGLASRHATADALATMADVVSEMFASLEDPKAFLVHDVRFHRAVAAGCGNRVLAALMEMVSAQFYELRKQTIGRARDLKESAEMHRRIYRAIRAHDREAAQAAMTEHLEAARHAQTLETPERED